PTRVRLPDLAGPAGRGPGVLAPGAVRLGDDPDRARCAPRPGIHPDIGSLTERRKWVPLPWAFSPAIRAPASAFWGYSKVATVRPETSQTAQTTRIRAVGAGFGRFSDSDLGREGDFAADSSLIPCASAASAAARSSLRLRVRRAIS